MIARHILRSPKLQQDAIVVRPKAGGKGRAAAVYMTETGREKDTPEKISEFFCRGAPLVLTAEAATTYGRFHRSRTGRPDAYSRPQL
jgi:hypothetical protein